MRTNEIINAVTILQPNRSIAIGGKRIAASEAFPVIKVANMAVSTVQSISEYERSSLKIDGISGIMSISGGIVSCGTVKDTEGMMARINGDYDKFLGGDAHVNAMIYDPAVNYFYVVGIKGPKGAVARREFNDLGGAGEDDNYNTLALNSIALYSARRYLVCGLSDAATPRPVLFVINENRDIVTGTQFTYTFPTWLSAGEAFSVVYNSSNNRVFVGGGSSNYGWLSFFSGSTHTWTQQYGGPGSRVRVAIITSGADNLYVGGSLDGVAFVGKVNPATGLLVNTITVEGIEVQSLAYDPVRDSLFGSSLVTSSSSVVFELSLRQVSTTTTSTTRRTSTTSTTTTTTTTTTTSTTRISTTPTTTAASTTPATTSTPTTTATSDITTTTSIVMTIMTASQLSSSSSSTMSFTTPILTQLTSSSTSSSRGISAPYTESLETSLNIQTTQANFAVSSISTSTPNETFLPATESTTASFEPSKKQNLTLIGDDQNRVISSNSAVSSFGIIIFISIAAIMSVVLLVMICCVIKIIRVKTRTIVFKESSTNLIDVELELPPQQTTILSNVGAATDIGTGHASSFGMTSFVGTQVPSQRELTVPGFKEVSVMRDLRYLSKFSEGGGGTVHLAVPLSDMLKRDAVNDVVVVKALNTSNNPAIDAELQLAFQQEISLHWYFRDCPYVAKFLGYSNSPRTIILKFYPRGSLKGFLASRNTPVTKRLTVRLMSDISKGLYAVHQAGFAHCDVKPDNILLEELFDGSLRATLTDFGITQVLDSTVLMVEAFKKAAIDGASIGYAAPEVIRLLRDFDESPVKVDDLVFMRDIYSLAMVLNDFLPK